MTENYPDHTIYVDLPPEPLAHPSFMIELVTANRSPVSCRTVQETVYFTITCFDITDDEPGNITNLLLTQQGVLDLFRAGHLTIQDRKISVTASPGGHNADQAYVDLQFEYFEDRSDGQDITPLMKEVYTRRNKHWDSQISILNLRQLLLQLLNVRKREPLPLF
nr:hypothetical protein [Desulfitobacterium hafniense]